ncbi:beta-galactosidase/beta-glucuronidase [Desulfitobacterium dichloroeliminans LMG P-21439]|uniref:Beta-galactosidase/beta-glucuronidase n=1 Tax=Desulfitobacterium dichloroeliminans (strain LMG P-21439 / DCA1) TaxID=871963 RepID=L0FC49_DESDL|nr:beta-galactosidase [Desulfitobacterium dichloroeliminans]AGA70231.1 beta-galactosidase/beta-glucuronidase [Desulfitobacterium dichloroeliminans LMG P-21439]
MFNRRLYILILTLAITLGLLLWNWHSTPGVLLESASSLTSVNRWEMDLGGQWKIYPSLRQAWITETDLEEKGNNSPLTGGEYGLLPSNLDFHVATKAFTVPAEWNARSLMLQINGVYGEGAIYLNGMESSNRIGYVESEGGSSRIQVPVSALRHGQENLLLLEITAPPSQRKTFLGSPYPAKGRITGAVSLQAIMETSIENPQLHSVWEKETALVRVDFQLSHHGFSEYGPWTVQGVISDGSAEVAQIMTQVQADESPVQPVSVTFQIPNGHVWSPEDPFLYQAYLTVSNTRGDRDDIAFAVGLKSLDYQEGSFSLNGQQLAIRGLALSPAKGYELRNRGEVADWLKECKAQGYNLIYFSGDLPDEYWLVEADRVGIGVWTELPSSSMIPAQHLPEPRSWEDWIRVSSLHPSVWAYTSGIGLEYNPQALLKDYEQAVQTMVKPIPAFNFNLTDEITIQGTWGEIEQPQVNRTTSELLWPAEQLVSWVWTALLIIVAWSNLVAVNWRYKELQNKKPKRALRIAWFWQCLAMLTREMTIAGLLTALIFNTHVPWAHWIPNQWPIWEGIRLQSPWLIWVMMGSLFVLFRLLQIGVVAPRMPGTPDVMGLAAWLERRYFWNWMVGVLWVLQGWGVPRSVPILAYVAFHILFLPLKIRDTHRVGGRYAAFLWVPGILILILGAVAAFRWEDFFYALHLLQQSDWLKVILFE